ncbi:hypothetical protein LINGRAHAP2_LOCUS33389 [Linum grandiflorum]
MTRINREMVQIFLTTSPISYQSLRLNSVHSIATIILIGFSWPQPYAEITSLLTDDTYYIH